MVQSWGGTHLRSCRKLAQGTRGSDCQCRAQTQLHLLRVTQGREERAEGFCLQEGGAPEGWASAPAHDHQLLLCCLSAEVLPHVNGKQGTAAVEDGGE